MKPQNLTHRTKILGSYISTTFSSIFEYDRDNKTHHKIKEIKILYKITYLICKLKSRNN